MRWREIVPGDVVITGFFIGPVLAQMVISVVRDETITSTLHVMVLVLWGEKECLTMEDHSEHALVSWDDRDLVIRDGDVIDQGQRHASILT